MQVCSGETAVSFLLGLCAMSLNDQCPTFRNSVVDFIFKGRTSDGELRHSTFDIIALKNITTTLSQNCGPGQLSRYSDLLRAGQSGDRIPVGARFSAPVQTGPVDYPASNTMGTGSFPGEKRPGRGVDHPPHLVPRLKKEQSLLLLPPLGLRGLFQGEFTLLLPYCVSKCWAQRTQWQDTIYGT